MANIDDAFRVEIISLDDQTLVATGNFDPSSVGYEAPVGSLFLSQLGDTYVKFDTADTDWKTVQDKETIVALLDAMNEPTGHLDRDESTLSFDTGTRTFTIGPRTIGSPVQLSYDYYIQGTKHTITVDKSIQIPDVDGLHYVYFDNTETLQIHSGSFQGFLVTEVALTAIFYWNVAQQEAVYFADERHGISMDGDTHAHFHISLGTLYISGLGLDNFNLGDGSLDAHAQCSVNDGIIRDEDLSHRIFNTGGAEETYNLEQDLDPIAQIPVIYRTGANGTWNIGVTPPTTHPFIYSNDGNGFIGANDRPPYNEWTGATWQLTEVDNNHFFFTHLLATNDLRYPIIAIQGSGMYQNKPQGQEAARSEFAAFSGLPFAEFYPIATLIVEVRDAYSNTPKARFVQTGDGANYIDWRDYEEFGLKIISSLNDHGNLAGLGDDDHTQYALAGSGSTRTFDLGDLLDATITGSPNDGDVLTWNNATSEWVNSAPPGAGGGEANTGANIGTGVGVFANKGGTTLNFYSLNSEDTTIGITLDGVNNQIDFTIDESTISHTNLADIGTNSHADIDTHIANTNNPHSTSLEGLTDVDYPGGPPTNSQILEYIDALGQWVNAPNLAKIEVDNIELASGGIFDSNGNYGSPAVDSVLTHVTGSTDLLNALTQLDSAITANSAVANLASYNNGSVIQTFDVTQIPIQIDVITREDSNFTHLGLGAVQINTAGTYYIEYDVAYTATGNNRTVSETYITIDGTPVTGSYAYGYHRTVSEGLQSATGHILIDLTGSPFSPVTLELVGHKYSGGSQLTSVAEACRLNILTVKG